MNGRSSDLLLVLKCLPESILSVAEIDVQDIFGASQQRDCPGFSPDSLFIREGGKPNRNQFSRKAKHFL